MTRAVSILFVMLSEVKYLSISLGFWRIEILHFIQDDRRDALCFLELHQLRVNTPKPIQATNPPTWSGEGSGEGRTCEAYAVSPAPRAT
ncbi:MAG: hypothetical protein QF745_03795 [Planctomycetota bacterium]|nr:hypothetical protein [Planctomycetota bacterium]